MAISDRTALMSGGLSSDTGDTPLGKLRTGYKKKQMLITEKQKKFLLPTKIVKKYLLYRLSTVITLPLTQVDYCPIGTQFITAIHFVILF